MAGKVDMGEAKRRGDYGERKANAIDSGLTKKRKMSSKEMQEEIMSSTFPVVMSHLFFRFRKKTKK